MRKQHFGGKELVVIAHIYFQRPRNPDRANLMYYVPSLSGQAKSLEDTEKFAKACLSADPEEQNGTTQKTYKVAYLVHEILPSSPSSPLEPNPTHPDISPEEKPTQFIGMVSIRSLGGPHDLVLPPEYTATPALLTPSSLSIELAYQFLPRSWGRGLATEAVAAFLDVLSRTSAFWHPFESLYVRAIVNEENPASLGVMRKVGLQNMGMWEWTGEKIWLGGKWTDRSRLWIFGKFLTLG